MKIAHRKHSTRRFYVLDIIRGIAVLLMVLAHSVYFFHNRTNPFLVGVENFGNTLAFTMFLVVSGAVTYIAYFKNGCCEPPRRKRLFKRFLVLLSSYYVLALLVIAPDISTATGFERWKTILDVILFRNTPSYTEFIAPFIFYSLLVATLPKIISFVSRSITWAIGISAYLYLSGVALYSLNVPSFLEPWKALLSGSEGYYRFPLLQYLPIFILGLSWGYWLAKTEELKHKREIAEFLMAISVIGVFSSIVTGWFSGDSFSLLSLRWPPSIPFLLVGTSFVFGLATILYLLKQLKKYPVTRDIFLILGQNAYGIFWTHIFLLNLYGISGGTKVGSFIAFWFLFVLIMVLTISLTTFIPFNFKFALTFLKGEHDEQEKLVRDSALYRVGDELYEETIEEVSKIRKFFFPKHTGEPKVERLIKKRHFLGASILIGLVSFLAFFTVSEEVASFIQKNQSPGWYSEEYAFKIPIKITNKESFSDIPKERVLRFDLNHKELVAEQKAKDDGSDIKLVWKDGDSHKEVEFWTTNSWNQDNTEINFTPPEKIKSGQEIDSLEIYFGNFLAQKSYKKNPNKDTWKYKYEIKKEVEEKYGLILSSNKNWVLKYVNKEDESIIFNISSKENLADKGTIKIVGTKEEAELERSKDGLWQAEMSIEDLEPGEYWAQAEIKKDNENVITQKLGFYVSYPLYITWTIDWEGYDAQNSYLNSMASVSDKYKAPMTQLFNPRLLITSSVSQERKNYLTNWVKNRRDNNDEEIGMHIHWFKDFVESAGVEYKNSHTWGDNGDGYGTLPSNYSQKELEKMIDYSENLFYNNGLGIVNSYRAGGWFANLDLLKALDNAGFEIDSSGRAAYSFGNNQKGFWELSTTQMPYNPSRNNQNSGSEPNLDLWEIPNNGGDTYWFSAEEMVSRFKENYQAGFLKEPKQVTFLSHPHWFDSEKKQKIETVFNHTNKYLYSENKGPIKYSTLETIYSEWLKE